MGALNYTEKAELLDLGGELLQRLGHCKGISPFSRNSRFTGSGQLSATHTKELAVKDKIDEYLLCEGKTKVKYNGKIYILVGSEQYNGNAMRDSRQSKLWRLYLQ